MVLCKPAKKGVPKKCTPPFPQKNAKSALEKGQIIQIPIFQPKQHTMRHIFYPSNTNFTWPSFARLYLFSTYCVVPFNYWKKYLKFQYFNQIIILFRYFYIRYLLTEMYLNIAVAITLNTNVYLEIFNYPWFVWRHITR